MLIGRKDELKTLRDAMTDDRSHFIAVYGRRRIGKTFLITEAFSNRFCFQHSGLAKGDTRTQLAAFRLSLKSFGSPVPMKIDSWLEAFDFLRQLILSSTESKKVIFIDELSWMDTPKSNFMTALENFWNGFASKRKDIVFIVCASATSWMLSKVIHSKGGLYNRLTDQINLKPFSLKECEDFCLQNALQFIRNDILQYYMVFGGVPYYWTLLKKGESVTQNIDRLLFGFNAPLKGEYKYLYASIFKKPENHIKIIEALCKRKSGMRREEIAESAKCANSGELSKRLEELESCGFIRRYNEIGAVKKNAVFQIVDNFTLFYHEFLSSAPTDESFWAHQIYTPSTNTWKGLAFERICFDHIRQIKHGLGIASVLTEVRSLYTKKNLDKGILGSQIDMLIIRKDQVINLVEIKYASSSFTPNEAFYQSICAKINDLSILTNGKYSIFPTLITTNGLVTNPYSGFISSYLTLDDLFVF